MASSAAMTAADVAAGIAACGSSCFCSAAAAMAASAETMADAAANQPSRKAGSTEPAFPSPYWYRKPRFLSLPHPLTSYHAPLTPFVLDTLRQSLSLIHI